MIKMAKKYKMIKIEESVYHNLIKLRALNELRDGQRLTMSKIIQDMIDTQPIYEISAKEISKAQYQRKTGRPIFSAKAF